MKVQVNVISLIIIAGIVISMVGAAYVWAVPLIEKSITSTDYGLVEGFMLELDNAIVDIANTGSGQVSLNIPMGVLKLQPYKSSQPGNNNSIRLDFFVKQPIIMEGSFVPIKTSNLDDVAQYGSAEPRIITLSRSYESGKVHLNMTMRYRELRSNIPRGYIIALCPLSDPIGCGSEVSGGREITLSYGDTVVIPRDASNGGDLTVTKINVEVI